MIQLHALLTTEGAANAGGIVPIVLSVLAVLVGLAFIFGFFKGFRKVSWSGLTWLTAVVIYALVSLILPKDTGILGVIISLVAAIACGLGTMVLFNVLALYVRPRIRWIKDDVDGDMSLAEFGLEFEPEYMDYDGEHDFAPYGMRIYKTGFGVPSVPMRLLGGLTCAVNVAMVLASLLGIFLMIVKTSALADTMGEFLTHPVTAFMLPYAQKYVFDGLAIGAFMMLGKVGYQKGLIQSICSIIISVATMAVVVASFVLPFTPLAAEGVLATMVERCSVFFVNLPLIAPILGKLVAGVCLLLMGIAIIIILKLLLANWVNMWNAIKITREMDGYIGGIVYAVIAAIVCLGIWFVLAGVEVLGLYPVSSMLVPEAMMSNALFNFAKSILAPLFGLA